MFLSNASIRRPVAMLCLIIALTILGINAYRKIGLDLMPKTDMPYVTITTAYPGASPEEIETDIAKPIEDQVVTIDGLKHVTSSCMENVCQTLLEFNMDIDVDIAAMDVREKLDLIRADFPEDVEDPKILKYDINAKSIIQLALTGEASIDELYDYADNTLRDLITVIPGVADVQLIGGAEREVHVLLDREKLAARGLTSTVVVQTIKEGIRTIPSGRIHGHGTEYSVKFDADYEKAAEIGNLEIANQDGQRCYIRDIGLVEMATEELRQKAFIDGRPCVAVKVIKKADANAVRVVQRVRQAMSALTQRLPGGMELVWITDDGAFIRATVSSAWTNVGQGILLTALILFIFLYNFRSLLVISITMPLTIVIGLFFIQFLGFTLNTSTMMAIGMSVGILVTNSIVVIEAIVKRLNETGDAKAAARLGTSEAFVAVLASAGTNIVVLFPVAMMKSMMGLFMKPFALTMVTMTAVSLFVSFTLTPILSSLLLKPGEKDSRSLLSVMERAWNRLFERVVGGYRTGLQFIERHSWAGILLLVAVSMIFLHALSLGGKMGSTMVSEADRGEIFVKMEFPARYDLANTLKNVQVAENLLKDLPHLRHTLTTIGKVEGMMGQSSEGVHLAQIFLRFSEKIERNITLYGLMTDVRSRLANFLDSIVTVSVPTIVGGQSSDLEMEIAGDDLDRLDALALKAQELGDRIPGIMDSDTTVRIGKPELRIHPKRAVLADLKSTATGLGMILRGNLEGIEAGTFKQGARNYDIVVKFEEKEGKEQVRGFLFPGAPGQPLLLSSIGEIEETVAPVQITRKDKRRISKLFANLGEGKPLGTAVKEISTAMNKEAGLPAGYNYIFSGMYEIMSEGQRGLAEAAVIAIIMVILSLAAILESFKQPVIILVTVPLALMGMFWALFLTGKSLEIFVLMGGVMLIGIVVNNAILIMDQFNVHVRNGIPRHRAMVTAACERFRPIVMITLAAVLGMMPLAFGQGLGAELRNACGIASMGGIFVSGVLTLFVMPAMYNLFTRRNSSKTEGYQKTEKSGKQHG